ncbi:MAG: hypothetical protein IJC06_02150 [Clostridia bacterium]|nr:hypothetical protein [Clostridia bacterium]
MTEKEICSQIKERLENVHICTFPKVTLPILKVSTRYPGIWIEHMYDAIMYTKLDSSKLYLAENIVKVFIDYQTEEGQLPYRITDMSSIPCPENECIGYYQIQEVVSFGRICWEIYNLNKSKEFLSTVYPAIKKWVGWLKKYRMTTNRGLIEMFYGYDTGHDKSARLNGFSCPGHYRKDGVLQNASVLPPEDNVTPVLAVDMNCNFYGNLINLSKIAKELGEENEAVFWANEAKKVKETFFSVCFNKEDCFFYDVDKNGNQRKYKSCTIFHLFLEGVLDPDEDADLIKELYEKHISNPDEFGTPYPYPSMAYNDPSTKGHAEVNCWGYFSQGLIALRTTLWLEKYGFAKDMDYLCSKWVEAWTKHFDTIKLGQELDPITGVPSPSSEWYSSTMLFYLYSAKRLGIID